MFHPIKAILRRRGYVKLEKIEQFRRGDLEEIRKHQPPEDGSDIARREPIRPRPAQ